MEKKIVGVLGVAFRVLLRYWAKDDKILSANIVDIEQFAQQCGLKTLETRKFERTIEEFIDELAEGFIKEFGNQIGDKSRKEEIINQLQKDIEKINIDEKKIILSISNTEDLCNLILQQSEKEREIWESDEIGIYTNCVRYISKVGTEFVSKLPSFTPEALKIVIQRQEEYYKELCKILEEKHSLLSITKNKDVEYQEYERIYRDNVIEKYSKVELIGASISRRDIIKYDISSAYVELSCIDEERYGNEIKTSRIFDKNNIIWIKGEAGSGKTTFLQWIAICTAKGEYNLIEGTTNLIPIVISLRSIAFPINLQDIVNKVTNKYGDNCPNGWISNLLTTDRIILLFDGLDEISYDKRKDVYEFVEEVIRKFPQIKVLFTARNSVNEYIKCNNSRYEILPMNMGNIKKFISYWHRSVLRRDAIVEDEEIEKLQYALVQKIAESQPLKALAKNPLLCAMICSLNYVNNEQLPEDKIRLYEKCCEMLMDSRDAQRNISYKIYGNIPKLDYSKKRKILEEVAFWMMNGGVSSESKSNVKEYFEHLLKDTNILANDKKEYNSEQLLDYFIERSGIIREPEEGVIDFVHKTFMEFLAVQAIKRNCAWKILVKEACNVSWRETIIMCLQDMGKDKVERVIKDIVREGKFRRDNRFILMAALGASKSPYFADEKTKKEIDFRIQKMIPPQNDDIVDAGIYLLPFLNNSDKFSEIEKERCLRLLENIGVGDTIPCLMSYISEKGSDKINEHVLNILSQFNSLVLDEYNVREQLIRIIINSIDGICLTISECMLNLIGNEKISKKNEKILNKVKCLCIICGMKDKSLYHNNTEFLWYLRECKEVNLVGKVSDLNLLHQFLCITQLRIDATNDLTEVISEFPWNLSKLKILHIEAQKLKIFSEKFLIRIKNLEVLGLVCHDKDLELNIDSFEEFSKLKLVAIYVSKWSQETENQIVRWKRNNDNLEIIYKENDDIDDMEFFWLEKGIWKNN